MAEEDSSDNAFSFARHAAAPAAGTQSNSSQSIDTGGSETSELRPSLPGRSLVAPRGRQVPTMQAIEDRDSTPGKRRSSARQLSPPTTPRTKAKPTSSNPPSPIQDATPSGVGSYQQVNAPSSGSDIFTAYQSELAEYKTSLDRATEEESVLQARLTETAAYAYQQFNFLENTTHQEMTSMTQRLQILNSELQAAQQEDEGATYRIEELERFRTMSNEAASHLEFRYSQLRSEFNEQIGQANAIMVHVGTDAKAHINQLRLELENAEMNAKQEALAVGYANDQTCALRIEMLEVANQNQTMKHTMSMNVRRLETELDAADMKRDEIMREFRSNIRSEHDRYAECEHHLALEESQLRLQLVHNEGLHSRLMTSESKLSEESSSESSGMRDFRIMGLRSELHMKQSLLDRMQHQLTESKNQYHELSCQQARRSSPSRSPHGELQYEMYMQAVRERDSLKVSKAEVDNLYSRARDEILDNDNLLKTYQKHFDSIGKKYQDALDKIDYMSNNPNVTSNLFDNLHNEIDDRDTMVAHLHTEVEAQKESLDRAHRDAGHAISKLNDRRLVIKGATDYSIPESHLTEMHHLANERFAEVEEMSSTISALRLENQAASSSSSLQNMPAVLFGTSNNALPRSECEEKCARLKAELDEMKREKNEEVRSLRDELKKMEEWKNERTTIRITSLKLKIVPMMKNKNIEQKPKPSKSSGMSTTPTSWSWRTLRRTRRGHLYPKGRRKRSHSNHGQRLLNFHPGREVSFMKFVLLAGTATTVIGKHGWLLVLQINQTWMH